MRSLESTALIAAAAFALVCVALASFPYHVLTVEPPSARVEMVEGH